jgi:Tol biopolymer transport system component
MRKIFVFIFLLSLTALWLIGCGSSKKIVPPPTTSNAFAFIQEVGSGTNTFQPMMGTFSTTSGTTTFSEAPAIDKSTNQPIQADIYSIILSADGKMASFDLWGGLDGTSAEWDIWVAPVDGSSNPTQVTSDTNTNILPQFSPDGTKVAFLSDRIIDDAGDTAFVVVTRKLDGTGEQVLALPPGGMYTWAPTYSPDGTKIAVEAYGYDSTNDLYYDGIWVMSATDGSNATMLTNPNANCDCYDSYPSYTADGSKIVFSRGTYNTETSKGSADIYIMNADGTGVTQLTNNGAINFDPLVVNVAGTLKIVFSSNTSNPSDTTDSSFELYSMNMDGTNVTRLTTNTEYDAFCGDEDDSGEAAAQAAVRHGPRSLHAGKHNRWDKVR